LVQLPGKGENSDAEHAGKVYKSHELQVITISTKNLGRGGRGHNLISNEILPTSRKYILTL
jgi:hypothetical protein